MSKLKTDFPPQHWCQQTTASPSRPSDKCLASNLQYHIARYRTKLCFAAIACLLTQLLAVSALAVADEDFELIETAQPACTNCALNNNTPKFEQTRVAMVDQHGQQVFDGQQGFTEQPMYVATEYPQSGGLGASTGQYPIDEQWLGDVPVDYAPSGYEQVDFGQTEYASYEAPIYNDQQHWGQTYDQEFDARVGQVTYNAPYETQNYGQADYSGNYSQNLGNQQTYTSSASSSGQVQPGLAQQKAVQAAQSGVRGHLGGGLGGAKYEGVGWSNHSAQNAINSCCYWGTRPTAQIGVSKGNDGFWYACVLYY